MALVLVGCEESQIVCMAFRALGHEAYSCDLKPCSGGFPEFHLQMDVFEAIKLKRWDLGIFHPECTYLTVSANKWLKDQPARKSGALVGAERRAARDKAIAFFLDLAHCKIPRIAIENPIGIMSTVYRKPDQIIHPWMFGDDASKATCLWLRNLPKLEIDEALFYPPRITAEGRKRWSNQCDKGGDDNTPPSKMRSELRSKTYPGLARQIAEQWGRLI